MGGLPSDILTDNLRKYYADSELSAEWTIGENLTVHYPQPFIRVQDQGFRTEITNVGHGLQRAVLFSIIEFLSSMEVQGEETEFNEPESDIIILVEEPEIYQHPHKQSTIYRAFQSIVDSFSRASGIRFQVIITTHSEKMIDMIDFHKVRIVRRSTSDEQTHSASAVKISDVSRYLAGLVGRDPMPDDAFIAKMHVFTREVCEGFFAKKVVLVEGVTDRAVLQGAYAEIGREPISEGISVISVDGKTKMDKPLYIFRELGIPVYCVFDSDISDNGKKNREKTNHIIQSILGVDKIFDFPDGCFPHFSAFGTNLEKYMIDQSGDLYGEIFGQIEESFDLRFDEICKTPSALSQVFAKLRARGVKFEQLFHTIDAIDKI